MFLQAVNMLMCIVLTVEGSWAAQDKGGKEIILDSKLFNVFGFGFT